MSDEGERPMKWEKPTVRRLRSALATLTGLEEQAKHSNPTTYSLACAFCNNEATPLRIYQAASFLQEGQLREVVQFLIFSGPQASLVILRLLAIMHGLPGNWELTTEFLEQQTPQSFKSLPIRAFSLIALIGGRKAYGLCDWSPVIECAFKNGDTEARWALSALSEYLWKGPSEAVLRVFEWETEMPYESGPSVWREIQWASYARSLCVGAGVDELSSSRSGINAAVQEETNFECLSSEFGAAAPHYVRVCGTLTRRRPTGKITAPPNESRTETSPDNKSSHDPGVVLTSTIRDAVCDMGAYLAYGVPFVIEGPSGCGKTALLSFLARQTSYERDQSFRDTDAPGVTFIQMDSAMLHADGDSFASLIGCVVPIPEGGGFRWRPGPIGAAAERGDWIVFENIGRSSGRMSSASAIIRKLANSKPGDRLEAPGRGDAIIIGRGFRCIATRTLSQVGAEDTWEPPGGWDMWYRITMNELSFNEKVRILLERYVRIGDCIPRVVDVIERVAKYTSNLRGPSFRTPTLREAVRICERLDSVKRGSGSLSPESAFLETMDVLVAWCSSEEHFDELSSIVSLSWSLSPPVGSDMYSKHRPDVFNTGQNVKIGRASVAKSLVKPQNEFSRLSLTGHTLRLLERTLRCLELGENVLLSGETGSGKTAVIQELASLMGKKLVVVNLSRQSELDDLIGGFRPVDADAVIPLLAKRFESAFCQCMSRQKNADFLDALQRASRSVRHHPRALRLMEGALKAIPKSSRERSPSLRQEWEDLTANLEKLTISHSPKYLRKTQLSSKTSHRGSDASREPLRKRPRVTSPRPESTASMPLADGMISCIPRKRSRKIDFEFSEGVLVQAIRSGDWILLDELNLAPPELLERLVSVLDVGKVALPNEQADVVSKQDGFALFGAMNPPTDAGKRPLPSVLRARFTEFHVGDMAIREDLLELISHKYFIQPSSKEVTSRLSLTESEIANDTADFYLKSYDMAKQGLFEDSTGKPVRFSLRSLARMLDFASGLKGFLRVGSEGKRRALFEGALTALGTQLPGKSRAQLNEMAETYLLRKSRARVRAGRLVELLSVPRNASVSVRMLHGFPVEVNSSSSDSALEARPKFIVTPAVEKTLTDVCRALVVGAPKLPILLQGPTAAGKTSLISYLAEETGNRLIRINNHEHTEISEYIGGYVATEEGSLLFSEGPLVRAARNGDWVMLDELNLAPPDVLESLNRLLDDNREVFIPETGEAIKAASGFRLFATQNPPGLYGGRKELSRAFRSRFVEVQVHELPDKDLQTILERRADIPTSFARKMVAVLRDLQMQRRSSGLFSGREGYITARDLFRWASRGPRTKEELAIHGFLLLAERARSLKERLLVRDVVYKNVGVASEVLSDENLYAFDLGNDGNDASKQCLDFSLQKLSLDRTSISRALSERSIVLTPSMRRMLTLLIHCMANGEPALLVGATGGGKTSSCAAIAAALSQQLLTINCHRHTEASDILGGFRPVRLQAPCGALFEWVDGPLVEAMKKGSWMLVDEINMADDAVIERLNSVLELERTLLLSEKGTGKSSASPEVIVAGEDFRILATMNPGGDFGKKELSPALRNRFTELWIPPPHCFDDYLEIIHQRLGRPPYSSEQWEMASIIVQDVIRSSIEDSGDESNDTKTDSHALQISMRDLTSWCDFIIEAPKVCQIDPLLAAVHGARLIFLDGLSVGLTSGQYMKLESEVWHRILGLLPAKVKKYAEKARYAEGVAIALENRDSDSPSFRLKVDCFYVPCNNNGTNRLQDKNVSAFSFDAPSTMRNSARIARAMCVGHRPVLLEGPPGSGKSSLIAALASVAGFKYSRVNLSEGTEMSDLVGCDAPGQDQGSFVFRRGPLLEALLDGSWILLDELNLASQSVLEGLNSVLDHRKTLFVPELNREFPAHPSFRIFGAQNSAADGGGRRGLPKSFLNRFTRVQIETPGREDIKAIVSSIHPQLSPKLVWNIIECLQDLRMAMKGSISTRERFGLRDALRWSDLLSGIGSRKKSWGVQPLSYAQLYACFDIAILRSLKACEREAAEACFECAFGPACDSLRSSPSLRSYGGRSFRIGFGTVESLDERFAERDTGSGFTLLEASMCWELQAMSFAINACWPVTLFSPSPTAARCGARRVVQQIASLFGRRICVFDGASLTDAEEFVGGYVQYDAIASMRQIVTACEDVLHKAMNVVASDENGTEDGIEFSLDTYMLHDELRDILELAARDHQNTVGSLPAFLRSSQIVIDRIRNSPVLRESLESSLRVLKKHHSALEKLQQSIVTEAFAPFKWRKSDLMNAIEAGEWIFMQDADACPPALLDRLNPIFERAAVSASGLKREEHNMTLAPMILAEAPSNEDGSPVLLQPHPRFRMFFSVSKPVQDLSQCGLSKALLDRSLKLCIEEGLSDHDNGALASLAGPSPGHCSQYFEKNAEIPDVSVSSYGVVSDGQAMAERTRFTCAMHQVATKDATREVADEEKVVLPRSVSCTRDFSHSFDDLPFTSVGEFVDNPVLSSMERDLASMRLLETAPNETALLFADGVRQALGSNAAVKQTVLQELWNSQTCNFDSLKQMLLLSGANAFLLGSTSQEDLIGRATILKERTARCGPSTANTVYLDRSEAAFQYITSLESLGGHYQVSSRSSPCSLPLDPLFSLDRSSQCLAALQNENDTEACRYRAKRLRAELLVLHRLQETWNRAEKTSADNTFFGRAKLTYMLQTKNLDAGDFAQGSFEVLAFDVVSSANAMVDAYYVLIQTSDGWEIGNEEEWMKFFAQATDLCALMTVCEEPSPSSVAAILYNIAIALYCIQDRGNPCFEGRLEELHQRLHPFKANIRNLLLASKRSALPTSKLGQDLELDLIRCMANGRRGKLSVTQIDALVSGLATLTMQGCDSDEDVLAKLRKVADFIKERTTTGGNLTFALDHWSRVMHQMSVRATQDASSATGSQKLLQTPTLSGHKDASQIITDCVSYMKCLPHSSLTSVACMQKLRWIVESSTTVESGSICLKSSLDNMDSLVSLTLLVELNSLLVKEHSLQDERSCNYQKGVRSLSTALFLAQGSCPVPFWSLSRACAEAACAAALISEGRHRIEHTTASSKRFLLRCLKSVADEGGAVNSAKLDSIDENLDGARIFDTGELSVPQHEPGLAESEVENDIRAAVQTALSGDESLPEIDKVFRFGKAWVAVGLSHLKSHHRFIKRSNGIDPAQFSVSAASLAFEKILLSSASSSAFDVFASHRLGGDSFSESIPAKRFSRDEKGYTDVIMNASSGHVFRPPDKNTFESYESFVDRVHATVARRIIDTTLLRNLHGNHSPAKHEQVMAEAVHLVKSCVALSQDLKCEGSFGHFRDISTCLALGLQEVQYGLLLFRKASEKCSIAVTPQLEKHSCFVSDMVLFPRAAHKQAVSALDSVKLCMKLSVDANCIMALANYLIGGESFVGDYPSHQTSFLLSEIVSEWKKRTLADEREAERKESLHVLREAGRKEMIPGGDIVERLGMDEDADFIKTFNPIAQDEEEELCGLTSPQAPEPTVGSNEIRTEDMDEDFGRRINPESFWYLHKKVFPPLKQSHHTFQSVTERVQQLSLISSHLFSMTSRILPAIDDMSSVWETFASQVVSRMHAISFPPAKVMDGKGFSDNSHGAPYNFYTDSNIKELVKASTVLQSLRNAISQVQQSAFKETGSHPVLDEVDLAIQRVAKVCKTSTPLSRIILGVENVLRKADEWHRLFATSKTRLDTYVLEVAKLVARWRKLEVQSWPLLLQSRVAACKKQGYRWIFLLYDAVLHEGVQSIRADPDCIRDVIASVDQFLRSSTRGEFGTRLEMVLSLGRHILTRSSKKGEHIETLGRCLTGLGEYYGLFLGGVRREVSDAKRAVDRELAEFTKLTSWNASHDLGSSCKMFKGKDKYLEYYRLKAASEKTRRKLHKLCLKVDAIVKAPVHESLSGQLSKVGFFRSIGDDRSPDKKIPEEKGFSERIRAASHVSTEDLGSYKPTGQSTTMSITLGENGSLLSRVRDFEEKLHSLGKGLKNLGNMKCELAARFCTQLRSGMRNRITQLQDTRVADIQVKKRALVELFKVLQTTGISPFERSIRADPHQWLSTPNPSLCAEYNAVANELFWKSALQIQRLQEVSDSRSRNPDIARDDASKVRAFCQCLFEQSCAQRGALSKVFDDVQELSSELNALNRLKFDQDTQSKLQGITKSSHDLKDTFFKLREVSVDLLACEEIFKQVVRQLRHVRSTVPSSSDQADFLIYTHSKDAVEVLSVLEAILSSAVAAVKETVAAQNLTSFEGSRQRTFGFFDDTYASAFLKAEENLSKLVTVLNEHCSRARDLSPDNFVTLVLTPVLSFVQDELSAHRSNKSGHMEKPRCEFDKIWSQISEDADAVIETILISSQRILVWNDLSVTTEGLQNKNENANLEEYTLSDLGQPGLMKGAHAKIISLSSALSIPQLLLSLQRNADSIRRLSESSVDLQKMDKVLRLQQVLASFVGRYLNTMIMPCLQKASQFHAHSLSLLRSLSSVFVGLCVEGFCRPPEHDNDSGDSCENDNRQGGGFGEAGDGDMSSAQNVSDQIEDEEQLLGLRDDPQKSNEGSEPRKDEDQDQDGVDMTTDFEGELQDLNDEGPEEESDKADKEMAPESGFGDNVIDERLWGNSEEPKADINSQEKDPKEADKGDAGKDKSELVAKNEERAGADEGKRAPTRREEREAKATEKEGEVENATDEEKNGDKPGTEEERRPEGLTDNKKENPFDNSMDIDSDGNGEDEENNTEDDPTCSQELQPKQADNIEFRENETLGNGFENENGADSNGAKAESDAVNHETESLLSDASHGDAGQEDPMMGLEHPKDVDQTDDNGEPPMEMSDVPGELSLEDCSDSGNASEGEQEEEDTRIENATNDSNRTETSPTEDIETSQEARDKMEEGNDNALNQQVKNLSTQIESMSSQRKKGNNAAGNEKVAEGKEESATNDQGTEANRSDDRDFPAPGGENDMKSTVEGSDMQGFQPAADQDVNGEVRDKMESGPSDIDKHDSFRLNPNPLRVSRPEELVEAWERHLKVMEKEQEDRTAEPSPNQPDETNGLWEYQDAKETHDKDMHALAAATEDQHRPLNVQEDESASEDPAQDPPDDKIDGNGNDLSSRPVEGKEGRNVRQDRSEERNGANSDAPVTEEEKETSLKSHPAHKAAEGISERTVLTQSQPNPPSCTHREVSDRMEIDIDDQGKREDAEAPQTDDKLTWQMETLEEESATELWHRLDLKVSSGAATLCEQLRLVLEPTTVSALTGGYRTGKRLNMRKVIEYVASDYQKDRIWLRRVKPDKRSYDVLVAIDDSASMAESEAGAMAIESLALVLSALSRLEIGRVGVARFGADAEMIRDFDEALPLSAEGGGELLRKFSFSQKHTDVVKLLSFIQAKMGSNFGAGDVEHVSLAFVISDGRLSNRDEVRRHLRHLKNSNVLIAFVILDQVIGDQPSIYEVKRVEYDKDGNLIISPYMEDFPIDFYTTVQDVRSLPSVLGDALRQWVEAANV